MNSKQLSAELQTLRPHTTEQNDRTSTQFVKYSTSFLNQSVSFLSHIDLMKLADISYLG